MATEVLVVITFSLGQLLFVVFALYELNLVVRYHYAARKKNERKDPVESPSAGVRLGV